MPPNDRAACSGNIPFRNGRAAREKAQLQVSAGQACAYFYCGRSRSANGGTRAQQGRGAPTRCKLRQAAPKRNHRARGAPAYAFRDALPIGQSNGRSRATATPASTVTGGYSPSTTVILAQFARDARRRQLHQLDERRPASPSASVMVMPGGLLCRSGAARRLAERVTRAGPTRAVVRLALREARGACRSEQREHQNEFYWGH
jgi:hypothetical protein